MSSPDMGGPPGSDRPGWFDKPRNVKHIVYGLYAVCAGLLVAELLINRKEEFSIEGWFGFYAIFGFLAYSFIVNAAKLLRRVVRRPEDYYSAGDGDG